MLRTWTIPSQAKSYSVQQSASSPVQPILPRDTFRPRAFSNTLHFGYRQSRSLRSFVGGEVADAPASYETITPSQALQYLAQNYIVTRDDVLPGYNSNVPYLRRQINPSQSELPPYHSTRAGGVQLADVERFAYGDPIVCLLHISEDDQSVIETLVKSFVLGDQKFKLQSLKDKSGNPIGLFQYLKNEFGNSIDPKQPLRMANFGDGGNMYAGELLLGLPEALRTEDYALDLHDFSPGFLAVMRALYHGVDFGSTHSDEDNLLKLGVRYSIYYPALMHHIQRALDRDESLPPLWPNAYRRLTEGSNKESTNRVDLYVSDIKDPNENLPKNYYHMAATFFTPCSITNQKEEFELSMKNFVESVQVGGVVCGALMAKTKGWRPGQDSGTLDSYPVNVEEAQDVLQRNGVQVVVVHIPPANSGNIGHEYGGMLVFFGVRVADTSKWSKNDIDEFAKRLPNITRFNPRS